MGGSQRPQKKINNNRQSHQRRALKTKSTTTPKITMTNSRRKTRINQRHPRKASTPRKEEHSQRKAQGTAKPKKRRKNQSS